MWINLLRFQKNLTAFLLKIAYIKDKLVVIPENPYRLYIRDKLYYGAGGSFLLVSLENGDSLGCG